jgi:hypothetical protein
VPYGRTAVGGIPNGDVPYTGTGASGIPNVEIGVGDIPKMGVGDIPKMGVGDIPNGERPYDGTGVSGTGAGARRRASKAAVGAVMHILLGGRDLNGRAVSRR